jgi:hypothetical protein
MTKRIYHPWHKWEDYRYNFYGSDLVPKEFKAPERYAEFLRDIPKFESALKTIVSDWKHSLEHNLSNTEMNRVAYMGQAAMALTHRVPHNVSCSGYNLLTESEKALADAKAQEYIDIWEASNGFTKEV